MLKSEDISFGLSPHLLKSETKMDKISSEGEGIVGWGKN